MSTRRSALAHGVSVLVPLAVAACSGDSGATRGGDATGGAGGSNTGGSSGDIGGSGGTGGLCGTGGFGGTGGAGASGGAGGAGGAGIIGPSCSGLAETCGPSGNANCCASSVVPGGGFYRSYDNVTFMDNCYPATVSDFMLDLYEVTVGRFRNFVAGYPGNKPVAGAGKNPNDPSDRGWDGAWISNIPADQAALVSGVKCDSTHQTWTDTPGTNENRPMNCIEWEIAFAFCIWDGGRLPTEAEWNYAAAGGSEQRVYPWSVPPTSTMIDDSYAVFSLSSAQDVGSKSPKGDGRWGQADLAGNVSEWVVDNYANPYSNPCANCANTSTLNTYNRVYRGGAFCTDASSLRAAGRDYEDPRPFGFEYALGVRCARVP